MAAAQTPNSLLLVVGGECMSAGLLAFVLEELERGVRSWDVDPGVCNLDEELKNFVSRHSATFSSIVKGQRSLHYRGETLETLVLLNPSDKSLCVELRNLLLDPAPHKLLVLAGPCLEETGELLLQTGGFSPHHFLQVLGDKEVQEALATAPPTTTLPSLTISCPTFGSWAQLARNARGLRLWLNPPARLPASEGLREFLGNVAESLEPPSPFDLLEPPSSGGFLRLPQPCCYIFPGGLGDAALFAVNGFTVLVNGGSNPKATFWKLVRHLDRVDAVLVTHAGADSLPGLNSLLRRKLAERHEAAAAGDARGDALPRLVSPALGVVFLNAPREGALRVLRGGDEAELAQRLLARLGIRPLPLSPAPPAAPTLLFRKLGVGRLELHVLPAAAAAASLLVWHPADPGDKVVRALFPGRTPPSRLLDGLGRLQHLRFLREPVVTALDGDAPRRAGSQESVGSRDGAKPGPERAAKREPRATTSAAAARPQPRDAPGSKKVAAKATKARRVPGAAQPPQGRQSAPAAPAPQSPESLAGTTLELPLATSPPRPPSPTPSPSPPCGPEPEPAPDASPSAATPSLPAELGSPHSTEVDESLSTSFEQVLPPSRRAASPHDVDLCLVSPCEFEHLKAVLSAPAPSSPGSSDDSARSQERARPPAETPPTSVSESLPTLSDSDPPLGAPGAADSDEDTEGLGLCQRDPPPEPLHVPPPPPDPPSICMVDPEMLPPKSARQPDNPGRPRKAPARSSSAATTPKAPPAAAARASGDRGSRLLGARSEGRPALSRKPSVPKPGTRATAGSASARPAASSPAPVYLDLVYLPSGGARPVDEDFFLRVRALCYVISGQTQRREEGMRALLDALLAGKRRWDCDLQVTLIPTFDSAAMHQWYEETHTQHRALGITVLGSNSVVSMPDEAFPACKVDF